MGRFNDMEVRASERFKHIGYLFRSKNGGEDVFMSCANDDVDDWVTANFSDLQEILKVAHRVPCGKYDELWIIAPETTLILPK